MWAYIKSGKVDTVYRNPRAVELDGIKHPPEIFTLWSDDDREEISVFPVTAGTKKDDAYYVNGNPSYSWNSGTKKVTESYSPSAKDLDTIKELFITQMKNRAYRYIKGYSWLVERSIYDSSKTIPNTVKTYVTAIKGDCDTVCSAIASASDVDAVASAVAGASWTSDSSIVGNRRD